MKGNNNYVINNTESFSSFQHTHPKKLVFDAPTGTRTRVSWLLVRRDNHYTTGTHHAGNIASYGV